MTTIVEWLNLVFLKIDFVNWELQGLSAKKKQLKPIHSVGIKEHITYSYIDNTCYRRYLAVLIYLFTFSPNGMDRKIVIIQSLKYVAKQLKYLRKIHVIKYIIYTLLSI